MARALADAAVGDHVVLPVDHLGALVELHQLVVRLERAIGRDRLAPGNVLGAGDVPRALCRLRHPRRRDDVAHELGAGPYVDQGGLLALQCLLDIGTLGADRGVHLLGNGVAGGANARPLRDERPSLRHPLRPPAVHQLDGGVSVQLQQPERERREPVVVVTVQHDGRLGRHARLGQKLRERLLVRNVAAHGIVELRLPVPADRAGDVPRVVRRGVHVDFDQANSGVRAMPHHPVGGNEHVGMCVSHACLQSV